MQKDYKQEAGFTLIEILIVLAVMGVVSTAIYNVHLTGWKAWKFNQEQLNLHQEGRIAMMKMVKEIKGANSFKIQNDNNELLIRKDDGEDNENSDYLKYFAVKKNSSDKNLTLYYQTQNTSDSTWPDSGWKRKQPITTKIVESITFNDETGDGNLVKITLKLEDKDENQTYELQNQVHLRNAE